MRQQLLALIVTAALVAIPRPLMEATTRIVLHNPTPIKGYEPRASRYRPRPALQLTDLPAKWQRLAWCESRHQLHANNHNTYYGLWQIHKGWYKPYGINPEHATIAQQYRIAQHIYNKQGAQAWSCSHHTNFK